MIVSNATPLLTFARIDALELLEHIVRHSLIPETVWHEVTRDPWRPGAEPSRHASWVEVHPVATIPPEIFPLLDRGEAEVIALAEAIVATEVGLDERAARAVATTRGGYYRDSGTARACQATAFSLCVRGLNACRVRACTTVSGL